MMHKTRRGSTKWVQSMARGDYAAYLTEVLDMFWNEDVAREAGIVCKHREWQHLVHGNEMATHIIDSVWTYTVSFVGLEVVWLKRYSHSPLGLLALLDTNDAVVKKDVLQKLQGWWRVLLLAETAAPNHEALKMALDQLEWTSNIYIREIFIGLDECKFRFVPLDLAEDLGQYTVKPKTTKPNEDGHNVNRDSARHGKSGQCGRKRRYHSLIQSTILEDLQQHVQGLGLYSYIHIYICIYTYILALWIAFTLSII